MARSSTSAALAAALLASSAALACSVPPKVLPGVVEVILRGMGAEEGCELSLPSTRPGCVNGSASFADLEHRPPIAVGLGAVSITNRWIPATDCTPRYLKLES